MTKEYKLHLKELLKIVKSKGILVETVQLQVGETVLNYKPRKKYKKSLGAIPIKSFIERNNVGVYVVYEDFDGSIKYYIYKEPIPLKKGSC